LLCFRVVAPEKLPVECRLFAETIFEHLAGGDGTALEFDRLVMIDDRHLDFIDVRVQVPVGVQVDASVQKRDEQDEDERESRLALEAAEFVLEQARCRLDAHFSSHLFL